MNYQINTTLTKKHLLSATRKVLLMIFVLFVMLIIFAHAIRAHATGPDSTEAHVRVVSADPSSRTYTFSCDMDVPNDYLRDFFIRPDYGDFSDSIPNEAESLDRQPGDHFTYTFQENTFYHIGCVIVNSSDFSQLYRGDLHIDLRSSPWTPNILPLSGSGTSATLRCDFSETSADYSTQWSVLNAQTGEIQSLGTTPEITYTASSHGLFDFICKVHDHQTGTTLEVGYPVEFFHDGDPYFADSQGVPHGISTSWTRDDAGEPDPEQDSPSSEFNSTSDQNSSIQCTDISSLPVTCTGTLTKDESTDRCRELICDSESGTLTVLACAKPDDQVPSFFEMYKTQSTDPLNTVELCLGSSCIRENGFATGNFICNSESNSEIPENQTGSETNNTTNTGTNTSGSDGETGINNSDSDNSSSGNSDSDESICFSSLQDFPVSCKGGELVEDTFNGCRSLRCVEGEHSLGALACPKPDVGEKNYFEVYLTESSEHSAVESNFLEICIGEICVDSGTGFAASDSLCTLVQNSNNGSDTGNDSDNDSHSGSDSSSNETDGNTLFICKNFVDLEPTCSASSVQGIVTEEHTTNSCRSFVCSADGFETNVLACPKPEQGDGIFEMYRVSGETLRFCLGSTCMDGGFVKPDSCDYVDDSQPGGNTSSPVVDNSNSTNSSTNNTSASLSLKPRWIAPSNGLVGVAPDYFHLELQESAQEHVSSDFEVWSVDENERVWSAQGVTGLFKIHTHTPDGSFEGSYAVQGRLNYSTSYKTRVKFSSADGTSGNWSEWRTFTTLDKQNSSGTASGHWFTVNGFYVEKFATDLDVPVQIAVAPSLYEDLPASARPKLYVTELYGKVKVIFDDGSTSVYADGLLNFNPFGSITGGGQMGVTGIVVEETTGDVFVSMVYVEDDTVKDKIVRFKSSDNGHEAVSSEVILDGVESSPSHQIQQLSIGPDGMLYANFGDGLKPSNAQNLDNFRGKIIRMHLDGSNPQTVAYGLRNPFGADWASLDGNDFFFATDNAPDTNDRVVRIEQDRNYGWGLDDNFATYNEERIATVDVSPVGVAFNDGTSVFPDALDDRLYVAVAGPIYQAGPTSGKYIREYTLDASGDVVSQRDFMWYIGDGYGTPIGLAFDTEGLYFTDIYGEPGFVSVGETEGNIYRIVPGDASSCEGCEQGEFRAGISIIPWYPKETEDSIEYIFECQGIDGSDEYTYHFDFGDGQSSTTTWDRQYYSYPKVDQDYTVSCDVTDSATGQIRSASLEINPSEFIPEQ